MGSKSPFPAGASPTVSGRPAVTHWTRRCRGARGHDSESDLGCARVRQPLEEAGIGEVHDGEEEDDGGSDSWLSAVKE
jgi:hypothetical protein